ncbi:hypothetical protein SKAU_G00092690 [Synaphobranchus kaupii]|uniref:phospholipase A2 n=1 Tax=Synaphobranchus kaupii TaxID=118154 RepID=A0A9Q1J6L6_SYNKA|nr:hypothetical protein SKAU_G00092690 [Synaphobranchus kaupii]
MWSVFFVFLSYLDRNFVKCDFLRQSIDAEKDDIFYMLNSTLCTKMSRFRDNYIHRASDGIEEVRLVYDPVGNLVDCSETGKHIQVKSFMYVCRLGFKEQRVKPGYSVKNLADMTEAKSTCQAFRERSQLTRKTTKGPIAQRPLTVDEQNSEASSQVLHRSKRGFTYPGTLWCGAGNIADHYDHLGEFAETDSCCRVHDHCPHVIHPFSSKFGYTNFKWHSICHCDCDNALKACLRRVNDTSSRVVGQAFFNVIEVPCFEFTYEEQCVERHWYGVCKKYDKVPVAVAKESIPYDFGGIDVIDQLTIAPRAQNVPVGEEGDVTESTRQRASSGSQPTPGPEEPSLGNVVSAAEDFIKVLATVSSSHSSSSSSETSRGDTQGADKKKKNKTGKNRKNRRRKGKGKGRKRKQTIKMVKQFKMEEAAAASCHRAEDVLDKNHLVNNPVQLSHKQEGNTNNFMDSVMDLGGKEEVSVHVITSEMAVDNSSGTIDKLNPPQVAEAQTEMTPSIAASASTATLFKAKRPRSQTRPGNKKRRKMAVGLSVNVVTLGGEVKDSPQRTADESAISTATMPVVAQDLERQHLEALTEKLFFTTATANTPTLKAKSKKSKERGGTKKRRKVAPSLSTFIVPIQSVA